MDVHYYMSMYKSLIIRFHNSKNKDKLTFEYDLDYTVSITIASDFHKIHAASFLSYLFKKSYFLSSIKFIVFFFYQS